MMLILLWFWSCSSFLRIFGVVQVSDDIRNAIVYLDAGCTECFQFLGAFPLLLEIGARAVCSLENTSPLDQVRLIWEMGMT